MCLIKTWNFVLKKYQRDSCVASTYHYKCHYESTSQKSKKLESLQQNHPRWCWENVFDFWYPCTAWITTEILVKHESIFEKLFFSDIGKVGKNDGKISHSAIIWSLAAG